ncbi:MAG: hypothetical protein ACRELS_07765 [Candidatus Rokuibacteriota bacterium]
MGNLYMVADAGEIAKRRRLVPAGRLVEAWPDLHTKGEFWLGEDAKALLDATGEPLPPTLELEARAVPVYYGPRLCDVESLPNQESLQTRALSARGIAVVWITVDRFGERTQYEPKSPVDPVFYLRRPGGSAAHVWRLVQSKAEAVVYMAEYYGDDPGAREWAEGLAARTWEEMIERYAVHR